MKIWKCPSDKSVKFDLIEYTKKFLGNNSHYDVHIYVGCDSQNIRKSRWTGYVTCVAFHIGTNDAGEFYGHGVHLIYKTEKYKKINDNWTRLWKEVEKSMDVAEQLRQAGILIHQVDLDFNQDELHDSNRLVSAGVGLFKGLGYKVASKPDDLIAARAADHIIHHTSWKNVKI